MNSGSLIIGGVQVYRVGDLPDTFVGGIGPYPLNSFIRSLAGDLAPSIGSCAGYEVQGSTFVVNDPYAPTTWVGMGSQLTITGPSGSKTIGENSNGTFLANLATPPSTWVAPGSYTLTNSASGSNIGTFTWDLTLAANVTPANIPGSVNLSQELTVNWTGGSAFPIVLIFGYAGVPLNASDTNLAYSQFVCTAEGSAGQFTIPAAVMSILPANGYGEFGVKGVNIQLAGLPLSTFNNLPGVAQAIFSVYESTGAVAKVQ